MQGCRRTPTGATWRLCQLYEYSGGLNPLQVTAAEIERWYDSLAGKVDQNTRALQVRGLRRFYRHLKALVPGYRGPFTDMEPKLAKKLNKTKKGAKQRGALTATEAKALLALAVGSGFL